MKNKRVFGLDILRFIAILFVIAVHSFLYDGFYNTSIEGVSMYLLLFFRNTTFLCVPLFMILTGFLKKNEIVDAKYYKKIKYVITSYIIVSIITIIFKYFYFNNHHLKELVINIFNYKTIDYAWYVEMYIGLFLLAPFLNILYKNIKEKKKKQLLIITMLAITSFGSTLSSLDVEQNSIYILPNYWSIMYPITYYFIGSYIREYEVKINKYINIIILISLIFLQTIIMFYQAHGYIFTDKIRIDYNNLFTIATSTLLFILIYKRESKGNIIPKIISKISQVSFNMYLISFIFDSVIYVELRKIFTDKYSLFEIPLLSIPIIFILSFISALIIDFIVKLLIRKKNSKMT